MNSINPSRDDTVSTPLTNNRDSDATMPPPPSYDEVISMDARQRQISTGSQQNGYLPYPLPPPGYVPPDGYSLPPPAGYAAPHPIDNDRARPSAESAPHGLPPQGYYEYPPLGQWDGGAWAPPSDLKDQPPRQSDNTFPAQENSTQNAGLHPATGAANVVEDPVDAAADPTPPDDRNLKEMAYYIKCREQYSNIIFGSFVTFVLWSVGLGLGCKRAYTCYGVWGIIPPVIEVLLHRVLSGGINTLKGEARKKRIMALCHFSFFPVVTLAAVFTIAIWGAAVEDKLREDRVSLRFDITCMDVAQENIICREYVNYTTNSTYVVYYSDRMPPQQGIDIGIAIASFTALLSSLLYALNISSLARELYIQPLPEIFGNRDYGNFLWPQWPVILSAGGIYAWFAIGFTNHCYLNRLIYFGAWVPILPLISMALSINIWKLPVELRRRRYQFVHHLMSVSFLPLLAGIALGLVSSYVYDARIELNNIPCYELLQPAINCTETLTPDGSIIYHAEYVDEMNYRQCADIGIVLISALTLVLMNVSWSGLGKAIKRGVV